MKTIQGALVVLSITLPTMTANIAKDSFLSPARNKKELKKKSPHLKNKSPNVVIVRNKPTMLTNQSREPAKRQVGLQTTQVARVIVEEPKTKEHAYKDGFYVTLGGGVSNSQAKLKRTGSKIIDRNRSDKMNLDGCQFHIGLGLGKIFTPNFYGGIKITYSPSVVNGEFSHNMTRDDHTLKLYQKHTIAALFVLGVPILNSLPHIIVGVTNSKWTLKSTSDVMDKIKSTEVNGWLTSLTWGCGVDIAVSRRVNIGMEYLHTNYHGKLKTHNNSIVADTEIAPKTRTFNLTLKRTF